MFQIKVVEKVKIHILCLMTYDTMKKCGGAKEAAEGNIVARCILD
jgi:hypothetical protein